MQHLPWDEVSRRVVRSVACTACYQRTPGSEALGPEVPRACEAGCSLFVHLPRLVQLARRADDRSGACERAVCESVCAACRLKPTAGEFCAEYAARTCPLSRYGAAVVAALQRAARSFEAGAVRPGRLPA